MNRISRIILFAVFIVVLMMAQNKPVTASAAIEIKDCKLWHTVSRGEYLSQIAKIYNTDYWTIAELNGLSNPNIIYPNQKLCVSLVPGVPVIPSTGSSSVYAISVKEDASVTLQGKKLAALTKYSVYMSNERTSLRVPIFVGLVTTDKDGAFRVTYNIPRKLTDVPRIKVTITNASGNAVSNWFYNATLEGNTGGYSGPVIGIVVDSSKINQWVKIKVTNLPVKMNFTVFIGKEGSKGEKGVQVGTLQVSKTGSVVASFDIPDKYKDRAKLDIRLENKPYGIVSYLTFSNKNK